jgi:hypothetical protein
MESKQVSLSKLEQDGSVMTVVNRKGEFTDVTEEAADLFRYDQDEIIGSCSFDLLWESNPENIKMFSTLFDGSVNEWKSKIELGDGNKANVSFIGQKKEHKDDSDVLVSEVKDFTVVEQHDESGSKEVEASAFDDIGPEELNQIVKNIRVDSPSGAMPLSAIMLDLAVGHNELEQYKEGALSLHEAVDQRLMEEQENNPNSKEVDVLKEVKETAFGLYLRLQRGDEELHGNREGKYSGYFN